MRVHRGMNNHPGLETVDDDIICTEKIIADRKTFFIDLKSNARGRVVRITEKVSSNRDRIMVPAEILDDFIAALEDIRRGKVHKCFVEMSACVGSCIGGPVMEKYHMADPVKDYIFISKYAGKKDFVVEWSIGTKVYWINAEESEDGSEINIVININHPFFKPYSNNEDFKIVLEKFVISFVVAEQQAKLTADKEGYVRASTIRHKMNEFLSKVSED